MERDRIGKCLCGKTVVHIQHSANEVTACHCGMCRKQAAGPMFYTNGVESEKYHFEDDSSLKVFDSSDFAERGFCSECGTILFWRQKGDQQASFNAELFPGIIKQAQFNLEIYTKDKPAYYSFANDAEKR